MRRVLRPTAADHAAVAEEVSRADDCGSARSSREPRWQPPDDRSLAMILRSSIRLQEELMATPGKALFQKRQKEIARKDKQKKRRDVGIRSASSRATMGKQ